MLKPVVKDKHPGYIDFRNITRYSSGSGLCYVYGAVNKTTKQGKPFVTLYIRDLNGISIPCYIFDIASPLLAGDEVRKVVNNIVCIRWTENYLNGTGLTLIADKVELVTSSDDSYFNEALEIFRGKVPDLETKYDSLIQFFVDSLGVKFAIPFYVRSSSFLDYSQGNTGGLLEHYYRMARSIKTYDYLPREEYRRLVATFALFIFAHSYYVKSEEKGCADITIVGILTQNIEKMDRQLNVGTGAFELVHMFFGYEPKDIYVRTVKSVSDHITRVAREFATYSTVPLAQEGDAGYGKIRRYVIEND